MHDRALVITIDGPAGSGKSTAARRVASLLGVPYLDTGAMYRALAWAGRQQGVASDDEPGLVLLFEEAHLDLSEDGTVRWNGRDITREIRQSEITKLVSTVAALPGVRRALVAAQRAWARGRGGVTEGRDQGSVVFPDADFKFFLDADLNQRAARRAQEFIAAGEPVEIAPLAAAIAERDRADRERGVGALKPPAGAVIVDTTHLSVDEVVQTILARVRAVDH